MATTVTCTICEDSVQLDPGDVAGAAEVTTFVAAHGHDNYDFRIFLPDREAGKVMAIVVSAGE